MSHKIGSKNKNVENSLDNNFLKAKTEILFDKQFGIDLLQTKVCKLTIDNYSDNKRKFQRY